ncbi:hypothetical protein RRG08_033546 [Elysia crispata]|uniref:Uncharacterized protein n=1 Tax=Elysia crispata TaxID=231223 RepID=A0AAE1CJE0_9GAST|nr:hypothetical protein RRG08_033546 [Elysia crispata]
MIAIAVLFRKRRAVDISLDLGHEDGDRDKVIHWSQALNNPSDLSPTQRDTQITTGVSGSQHDSGSQILQTSRGSSPLIRPAGKRTASNRRKQGAAWRRASPRPPSWISAGGGEGNKQNSVDSLQPCNGYHSLRESTLASGVVDWSVPVAATGLLSRETGEMDRVLTDSLVSIARNTCRCSSSASLTGTDLSGGH